MAMHTKRITLTAVGLAALCSSACDWTVFDDFKSQAAVRVYDAPGSYRGSLYGTKLETVSTKVDDVETSSFIASAGADSPIVFEGMFTNGKLEGSANLRCEKKKDCEDAVGIGATLIPFEVWAKDSARPQYSCVLAPGTPNEFIFCATNASKSAKFKLDVSDVQAPATALRFSGTGLPTGHPLGIALIGVYAESTRSGNALNGSLFMHSDTDGDNAPLVRALSIVDPRTKQPFGGREESVDFGYAVEAKPNGAGELVIAISQPTDNRVVVATYDPDIELPDELDTDPPNVAAQQSYRTRARACLKSPDPALKGFGKILTIGDVNGDGEPDILVGIDPTDGKNGTKQRLWLYDGRGMPAPEAAEDVCPLWDVEPVQIGCYDGVRGIACKDTQFGASVAIGDVDGDGVGDLLVGAPKADVQGVDEAGVVWIIPGSDDAALDETGGLDFDAMTNLYGTGLEAKGHLGTSVAAVRSKGRDEPLAGAPGADAVYVFMCSALETDVEPKNLCLPK